MYQKNEDGLDFLGAINNANIDTNQAKPSMSKIEKYGN